MPLITLAYTNNRSMRNLEDLISSQEFHKFEIDVADTSEVGDEEVNPVSFTLLDASTYQHDVRVVKTQSFTTLQNLRLYELKVGKETLTIDKLLRRWFHAQRMWIATPELFNKDNPFDLIEVARNNETAFAVTRNGGVSFLEETTISYKTAQAVEL